MSDEQNDSPAFRLRPRRGAPKSYYTVRLEYSANPNAFIRERPRSGTKKRTLAQKAGSYPSKARTRHNNVRSSNNNTATKSSSKLDAVQLEQERKLEEKRMRMQRDIAKSITTNTMISPFIQRLELDQLEAGKVYAHNYITLRLQQVGKAEPSEDGRELVCLCCDPDNPDSNVDYYVHLYDHYANLSLVKAGKLISIAKFSTQSVEQHCQGEDDEDEEDEKKDVKQKSSAASSAARGTSSDLIVVVKYQEPLSRAERPLIPFVSITDMIEQPTEPYVEISPPSPSTEIATPTPTIGVASSDQQQQQVTETTTTTTSASSATLLTSATSHSSSRSATVSPATTAPTGNNSESEHNPKDCKKIKFSASEHQETRA